MPGGPTSTAGVAISFDYIFFGILLTFTQCVYYVLTLCLSRYRISRIILNLAPICQLLDLVLRLLVDLINNHRLEI